LFVAALLQQVEISGLSISSHANIPVCRYRMPVGPVQQYRMRGLALVPAAMLVTNLKFAVARMKARNAAIRDRIFGIAPPSGTRRRRA
jgi:hypothetical protein